jgi:hypothetical protein
MNSEIGGYFGLELLRGKQYHPDGVMVNTGRNAFEYIILSCGFNKIYLPYFTCEALLEPLFKWAIEREFYYIDEDFRPIFNFERIKRGEGFLYCNYFGLHGHVVNDLSFLGNSLIVDNAQAFFEKPIEGLNTFYSPRKFFGVPDGGILYCNYNITAALSKDQSYSRFSHLLKRLDMDAEVGFPDYKSAEKSLGNQPILQMSNLTYALLDSLDYQVAARKRIENFLLIHQKIGHLNKLNIELKQNAVPLSYPFLGSDSSLRQKLVSNKVYCPLYWPNVLESTTPESFEYMIASGVTYIPIDQRYNDEDLGKIAAIILEG